MYLSGLHSFTAFLIILVQNETKKLINLKEELISDFPWLYRTTLNHEIYQNTYLFQNCIAQSQYLKQCQKITMFFNLFCLEKGRKLLFKTRGPRWKILIFFFAREGGGWPRPWGWEGEGVVTMQQQKTRENFEKNKFEPTW